MMMFSLPQTDHLGGNEVANQLNKRHFLKPLEGAQKRAVQSWTSPPGVKSIDATNRHLPQERNFWEAGTDKWYCPIDAYMGAAELNT